MRRETVLMVTTFVTCALGGSLWNGCDTCECPEIHRLPAVTSARTPLSVGVQHQADSDAPIAVIPESGSLQVTGDTVVVEYRQAGVNHRVVYDVTPRARE